MTKSSTCLSILQLTDLHVLSRLDATLLGVNTAYYFNAVLDMALAEHDTIDLILLTGDLAQDPVPASYDYIVKKMTDIGIDCMCLPGNHDDYTVMQKVLNNGLISCKKQTILDNWQIICLNSQLLGEDGGFLAADELVWLQHCLTCNREKFALIAVHHHCLLTQSDWMDEMMIQNSDEFLRLIRQNPQAKLVVNGHIHQEMDKTVDGIRILGTPSTCFQFKPGSELFDLDDKSPGYRLIQLYPDGTVNTQVVRLAEQLLGLETDTNGY